jgi:tetratricopeptide (TPR) repeat protein
VTVQASAASELSETPKARRAAAVVVALVAVAAYAASLGYDFVWDDTLLIQQSYRLHHWGELPRLLVSQFWSEVGEASHYYRPLITLSFFLDMKVWGLQPFGFHLTNLLAHVAVILAVLAIARRVAGGEVAAVLAALAFALQPVHTESVSFVSGRTDVLATLFFLLALLAYDRGRDGPRWGFTACSLGAYLLALLSKEVAITLPAVLALWDWRVRDDLRDRRAAWRGAARYAPYGGVLALYLGLRWLALRDVGDGAVGAWAPPITRLLTTLQTVASYAWIAIVPYPANAYRVIVPVTVPPDVHWWVAMVGLGAAMAGTAWARWRMPVVGLGALWFWITLAPSAGVNLLPLPTVLMAERFLYLPTVGYCVILGWVASWLLGPVTLGRAARLRLAPTLGLAVLLLAYFVLTLWRNEDWRDEDRLYSRMAEASPAAAVPHVNLAFVELPRGEITSANQHLREAVRLAPGNPRAQAGLGLTETLLGHLDAGLGHGLRARELAPDNADVLASLGALYLARGEPARAVPELRTSLRVKPNQVHAALNLALALAWLDQPEAAEAQLERALGLVRLMSPDLPLADRITAEVAAGRDSARSRAAWGRYVARLQAGGPLSPALAADLDRAERRLGKISVAYPEPAVTPSGRQ